jgi:DNA excision repair protein ERCC-4
VQDVKSYVKPTGKYPPKKPGNSSNNQEAYQPPSIQQKLVLLTLAFPRVRILWSSSPYATADIFNDLKANSREPDYAAAVVVGADSDPAAGQGLHGPAEELLHTLPGITAKNAGYVMNHVRSMRELCELRLDQVQDILGDEPGRACWEFLHWGEAPSI